ncbi:radical SAM protein [Sulfolobaceae archaeon RB850M]
MKFEDLKKVLYDDFQWYFSVMENRMPAKYLILKRIEADFNKDFFTYYDNYLSEFLSLWKDVRGGKEDIRKLEVKKPSLLDLLSRTVDEWVRKCSFCRWNCRIDRSKRTGACKLNISSRVASYFHHRGEELIFRGTEGSGTIFFTSCNMRCAFCQNGDISRDKDNGVEIDDGRLAGVMKLLRLEGVHNINLVGGEPTVHLHTIVKAIRDLAYDDTVIDYIMFLPKADPVFKRRKDVYYGNEINVPILWNSNFFMSEKAMKLLRFIIDIWLPDFKFGNNKCALRLSRTPWYFETVTGNLLKLKKWGEEAVIRHLVMPNHVEDDTFPVLEWISKNMGEYWVNIMDQYHPDSFANPFSPSFNPVYSDISRYPTREEIEMAWDYARKLGIKFDIVTFY